LLAKSISGFDPKRTFVNTDVLGLAVKLYRPSRSSRLVDEDFWR
jgi:hypothetical protein